MWEEWEFNPGLCPSQRGSLRFAPRSVQSGLGSTAKKDSVPCFLSSPGLFRKVL